MSDDERAELEILRLSNERGKFAVPIGPIGEERLGLALVRLMERRWVQLIDVVPLDAGPGIFRIFILNADALAFLKQHSHQQRSTTQCRTNRSPPPHPSRRRGRSSAD